MATAKKKVSKLKKLANTKLHVVLGDSLMSDYAAQCATVGDTGMTKSEVGRLLCEAFANGDIKITPPKVSKKNIKL